MRSKAAISSHPIHPMLVAFPIALWVMAFIFSVIGAAAATPSLWAAGFYCIIAGCIGATLAAVAGTMDLFGSVPPRSSGRRRGLLHGLLNSLLLLAFIFFAWWQGSAAQQPSDLQLALMGIALLFLGYTGWLGGTLVYRNQIGVDHRYANAGKWRERELPSWDRPACNQGELSDGQMMFVRVKGERAVVAKCAEGIFAFSDHCTHKGGPLADGALVGCTVQCPWHGSQFDVRTGRVVSGPAEEQITLYNVDVRAGEVYLSPKSAKLPRAA
jgi:nitrite reductase/ring-hydroxylating ferredoxin subunit/uncharacterized membrane protein